MTKDGTWADRVFLEARELEGADREALLAARCGNDQALRDEVMLLLGADAGAEDDPRWAPPSDTQVVEWLEQPPPLIGQTIDGFTIERLIASGGMGAVYRAQQAEPARPVALKLLRTVFQTRDAIGRLRREGRVLARLSHPAIAQIYHSGRMPDGTPYLAMEVVPDAQAITDWAEGRSPGEVIRAVETLCDAVHHGHLHGIAHRDIKPSNVLVSGEGQLKLIDFGVAKLLDEEGETQVTRPGYVAGTLTYLSPEQIRGPRDAIDARADVYALGVLLYELLTGRLPHDVAGISTVEAARRIAEERPRFPAVGGDLDVVLKTALAREPARRYPSALTLAEDLRRWRAREPIEARPASLAYHFAMFTRRHRGLVLAGALAALALIAGTVVSVMWARRADEATSLSVRALTRAVAGESAARAAAARAEKAHAESARLLEGSQQLIKHLLNDTATSLSHIPGTLPVRSRLLASLQKHLAVLRPSTGSTPSHLRLAAHLQTAIVSLQSSQSDAQALDTVKAALGDLETWRRERPGDRVLAQLERQSLVAASQLAYQRGHLEQAKHYEARALEGFSSSDPTSAEQAARARALTYKGWRMISQGRAIDAGPALEEAREVLQALPAEATGDRQAAVTTHIASLLSAVPFLRRGDLETADRRLDEAKALLDALAETSQSELSVLPLRGHLLAWRGKVAAQRGHKEGVIQPERVEVAIDLQRRAAEHFALAYRYERTRADLRAEWNGAVIQACRLSMMLSAHEIAVAQKSETPPPARALGRLTEAVALLTPALEAARELVTAHPHDMSYRHDVVEASRVMTKIALERADYDVATIHLDELDEHLAVIAASAPEGRPTLDRQFHSAHLRFMLHELQAPLEAHLTDASQAERATAIARLREAARLGERAAQAAEKAVDAQAIHPYARRLAEAMRASAAELTTRADSLDKDIAGEQPRAD